MGLPAALTGAVRALLASVDREAAFLETPLLRMCQSSRLAVPSFLGFELTLVVHGQHLQLRDLEPHAHSHAVRSSLQMPLSAVLWSDHEGSFTFWAATPGALVDLAADLRFVLGLADDTIVLDQDCPPELPESGLYAVAEASRVNQAIGVLIENGHPPAQARRALEARARELGRSLDLHARTVIADASSGRL